MFSTSCRSQALDLSREAITGRRPGPLKSAGTPIAPQETPAGRPARFQDDVTGAAMHPLDPLTAEEFRQVAAVLKHERGVDERWRLPSIELREPAKAGAEPGGRG